jgi:hypothetical protein
MTGSIGWVQATCAGILSENQVRNRPIGAAPLQNHFDTMTDTSDKAERLFKPRAQPEAAMTGHEREQRRIRENLGRLKAERLAREANTRSSK